MLHLVKFVNIGYSTVYSTDLQQIWMDLQPREYKLALKALKLSCSRDERLIFQGLSFELSRGEILQVIAKNGAGKTSLLKMLCGLLPVTNGQIQKDSLDNTLFIGHKNSLHPNLSPMENLSFQVALAAHKPLISIEDALKGVGLFDKRDNLCSELSAGQCQRAILARLLLTSADLWILDEPFSFLDQQGIALINELMTNFVNKNGMIVMTTHYPINHLPGKVKTLSIETAA